MKFETKIYSAFCGVGKSYLCDNFPEKYKELECWMYRDGDFPNNYIQDVLSMIGKTEYLFISTNPVILRSLNELGFGLDIKLIYPDNKLRNEYLDRYLNRDSSINFIGNVMKNWNTWIDELKDQKYCDHIVLKEGEYLQDVIKN